MSAALLPNGKQQYEAATGVPAVGYKLYTFDTGTAVPRTTWADSAQTTPNANPIILDARGEATIFWAGAYRVTLKDPLDNTIWTVDGVSDLVYSAGLRTDLAATGGAGLVSFDATLTYTAGSVGKFLANIYARTAAEIAAGVTPTNYYYSTNPYDPRRYGAVGDGVTDDTVALQRWINVLQQAGCGQGFLPGTSGSGYKITSPLTISASLTILGAGINHAAIISTVNGDIFQIAAGTPYVTLENFRLNTATRYQNVGGAVTVNAAAAIRNLGTAVSANSNHCYRNLFIDGFLTGIVGDGLAFSLIDNCQVTFGKNGVLAATFPVNVQIRGGAYQCGDLANAGTLTGSIGVRFGDGATATQGCTITDACVITGFATNVFLHGANYCKVIDSYLDFTNGVGVLIQSGANAATNHDIIGNYMALTALGTTGIRLLNGVASSNPEGNRIHNNIMIMYAAGAGRGILCDGGQEMLNSICGNSIKVGSVADVDIQQGTGHVVIGNHFGALGFSSTVSLIYDNNIGTLITNPNTFVQFPLFQVLQKAITYSASMTPDLKNANSFTITANNGTAFTINAPTNEPASGGLRLRIRISNTSGGALGAVTWGAAYKVPAGITYPATGFNRTYEFELGTAGGTYYLVVSPTVDIPN